MLSASSGVEMYSEIQVPTPDNLVREYAVLVKRIAHHLIARMPSNVQTDDLIQAGMIGLLEAATKYDGSKGASFETYAGIRIRGAMLDEIRKGDWVPRSVHRNVRSVSAAIRAVEARLGRDATDREVAEEMGVELEEYFAILKDANSGRLFSFEDLPAGDSGTTHAPTPDPLDQIQKRHFQEHLATAISFLPEREQLVLSLYYDDELNLKEIGEVLGVSESRISQIHTQAALRLRAKLVDWVDEK
ncbi:MAG: RNA polymerase sigma factor for flagellar operon FliA [Candidatus Pseudothioglobus sp.]|jgi:RNA polymerase sigma factor for flagellar operon FliA